LLKYIVVKFHNFTWSINHTLSNWKWGGVGNLFECIWRQSCYDVITSLRLHVTCWVLAGICWWSVLLLFGVVVCLLLVIYKMGIFCILFVYLCIHLNVLRAVLSLILGGLCVGCAVLRGFLGSLFFLCIFCCIHC